MTPLMRQYDDIKKRFPDELVLFQVGDFYELFYDDAKKAAAFLGITLTKRGFTNGEPIPLCGVPRHTVDHYLMKLVRGGFRAVLCDQLSQPEAGKVVERGVTQVLTPGMLTDSKLLDEKSATYSAIVTKGTDSWGLIFIELLTSTCVATIITPLNEKLLEAELSRFLPQEVIVAADALPLQKLINSFGYIATPTSSAHTTPQEYAQWLATLGEQQHAFIIRSEQLTQATSLMHAYLLKNNATALSTCTNIELYTPDNFLILDSATQRNLEIIKNSYDGSSAHTLFSVLDHATTSMGSRTIKKWLLRPLVDRIALEKRLSYVEALVEQPDIRDKLTQHLQVMGDIERAIGRIALKRAQLNDYLQLMRCVKTIPLIISAMQSSALQQINTLFIQQYEQYRSLYQLLKNCLNEDTTKDWLVKPQYHDELDRLRTLVDNGSQALLSLEQQEQKTTGINSLKIRFNSTFGYAFEITKSNFHLIPTHYRRVQTLKDRERFVTQELKDLEYDMQHAKASSIAIEKELFNELCLQINGYIPLLKKTTAVLADLDAYIGFAHAAHYSQYVKPTFTHTRDIIIEQGRHPVIEKRLQDEGNASFISNTLTLTDQECLWIITGPNMGGKSTFLRQNALIHIMAQAGSFVPAQRADLPILDRIFTRIGAADTVARGKSTFWVEMEETALICNQATDKSLVILDEVGRGTSTYDGLAIAQAVLEYIYSTIKARCLFATHYYELTALANNYPAIATYHTANTKSAEGIVLLHQIKPGKALGSFGIDVAQNAQVPFTIIARAQEILTTLPTHASEQAQATVPTSVFRIPHPYEKRYIEITNSLNALDCDNISPRQAFDFLCDLKKTCVENSHR